MAKAFVTVVAMEPPEVDVHRLIILHCAVGRYVEGVGPLQLTQTLPSGIPKLFVFIWYFVYMFMVHCA